MLFKTEFLLAVAETLAIDATLCVFVCVCVFWMGAGHLWVSCVMVFISRGLELVSNAFK